MMDQLIGAIDIVVQLDTTIEDQINQENNDTKILEFIQSNALSKRSLFRIQQQNIETIQKQFKSKNRLLFKVYNTTNVLYSCTTTEFKEKVSTYMTQTSAYSLIEELTESNRDFILQQHLDDNVEQINKKLFDLFQCQRLPYIQHLQMNIDRSKVQLDNLVFLPDNIQQNEVLFRPIMKGSQSVISHISDYLHDLLQPFYEKIATDCTFSKGSNAIYAVEMFAKQGFLRHNTLFITWYINDLYTILSHSRIIDYLRHFLIENVHARSIHFIPIDTIIQLVNLVLHNQYFIYDDKLYRQNRGFGTNSSLGTLLANIYLFYWQKKFVIMLKQNKQVFGRCFDQAFMTWNGTIEQFCIPLKKLIRKDPYIEILLSIGAKVHYLDVEIAHSNGHLASGIYHYSKNESYALPYILNHPTPDTYTKLIREALIRAICCCIHVHDFEDERQYIILSCVHNRLSMDMIIKMMERFFKEFYGPRSNLHMNQDTYDNLRDFIIRYDQRRTGANFENSDDKSKYSLSKKFSLYDIKCQLQITNTTK